jgi:drug/metabolite transporter (DMT)-like permease
VSARFGALAAAASGVAFGVTVIIGRELANHGVTSETALGVRFTIAALMLLALQALHRGQLLPVRGERLAAFLLGAIGYAAESTCFYLALERGNAAAVGLLFYSYPAMVAGLELASGGIRPTATILVALVLSAAGAGLIVTAGSDLTISASGAALALCAALIFSIYFLASHRLVPRTDALVNAAWVALGAGVSLSLRGIALGRFHLPSGRWLDVVGYALATGFAFGFMFAALRRLGPTRTSVLLTVEVVSTVVLAAIFLDERLRPVQLIGGFAIAVGAVIVAVAGGDRVEPVDVAAEATPP